MGASSGNFVKYPRTPHLFGSTGTSDDKHLGETESLRMLADPSLIVEEKIDGTNVGIHFSGDDQMQLQCRGHLIGEGMHPQYDLFKQWAACKRSMLRECLGQRWILFGEWVYATHSIHYRALTHYFYEFDVYDKQAGVFLDLESRLDLLSGTGIITVPIIHTGPIKRSKIAELISKSAFSSEFENPTDGRVDARMEGIYLRTEANGVVTSRAKYVRPEFVEKIKQSTHWQHRSMVPNTLAEGVDIWQ